MKRQPWSSTLADRIVAMPEALAAEHGLAEVQGALRLPWEHLLGAQTNHVHTAASVDCRSAGA